jgi:hypothetical protein
MYRVPSYDDSGRDEVIAPLDEVTDTEYGTRVKYSVIKDSSGCSGCNVATAKQGEVTDTETVAFGTEAKVSNITVNVEDNIHKLNSVFTKDYEATLEATIEAEATESANVSVPVQQYKMCSICTKSVKHRRVSCAKCNIQWCLYCYTNIIARASSFMATTDGWTVTSNSQSAHVRHIRCPNCRMLYQKSNQRMCL